ncbi:FAD-binding molybdopterin dehydrogenase [Chryseobacterium sp. Leaf180]|uniref:FAD binding domain-containing protein n=1 Tax=Chryseobacterium sp. Leaf180 TaxID=1736289 RepID=UPI000701B470|nr:xanthine dehydrogenase family protein subunit M [Chryseobacterium sp. Leaf180]KQR94802.1 FAD-binding molybdopterin dehydrogenase [Chryseobacterium sp. Leaf180]
MNDFSYLKAVDLQEASTKLSEDRSNKIIAGGTNIVDLMKYFITESETLIDINAIQDLKQIKTLKSGNLMLGALMTNAETAYHPEIEKKYPLLSQAILAGASAQIRNMATNGGNLLQKTRCYYYYDPHVPCNKRIPGSGCPAKTGYNRMHAILGHSENCIAVFPSDMCVALAALNATVHIESLQGQRSLLFTDFHKLPGDTPQIDHDLQQGEIITGIELPNEDFSENYSYLKIRERSSYAFALISVATAFKLENSIISDARIALGGVAHKPWRNLEAEDYLKGKACTEEHFSKAADIILADAKAFEYNEFKIKLAKKAIVRNCKMALDISSHRTGAKPSL